MRKTTKAREYAKALRAAASVTRRCDRLYDEED